jgi:hypothetical protein
MRVAILILLLLPALLGSSYAASNKEESELQERCGKDAEKFFERTVGNGPDRNDKKTGKTGYANHYNRKLNKCFILVTTMIAPKYKNESVIIFKELWNIDETKAYGNIVAAQNDNAPIRCTVLNDVCHSEEEWDSLVKAYMEE